MLVLMMNIREVVVAVLLGFVGVLVAVLPYGQRFMGVRMMSIGMVMRMRVRLRGMNMEMNVFFGDGEIGSQQHHREGEEKQG